MSFAFLVLLTATFLAGAVVGAFATYMANRLILQGSAAGKRVRKPRPPRCYAVEPTNQEEKLLRPRKRKHPPIEDEASGLVEPVTGADLAV